MCTKMCVLCVGGGGVGMVYSVWCTYLPMVHVCNVCARLCAANGCDGSRRDVALPTHLV